MAKGPRVSVVIPCFNGGADLPGALDSLDAQTFRDFEVVVVDDGSDDGATLGILDSIAERVRIVRQGNRGLPAARNAGFATARADLVLPLDCDDRLDPRFLEATVDALGRNADAAYAFTDLVLCGEKKGVLAKRYNLFTQLFVNQLPYCMLIRRADWQDAGGYDESLRDGYEDWELNIRLASLGRFGVAVSEPLFLYRVDSKGMLRRVSNRRHAQLWRHIQDRHAALYRLPALWRCWRAWRSAPRAYPAWLLVGLLMCHRALPASVFNRVFSVLLRFSASARADAGAARSAQGT